MTLCIHTVPRTSCDQLGYGVIDASLFDFILGGEALKASAAEYDDFVFEFSWKKLWNLQAESTLSGYFTLSQFD